MPATDKTDKFEVSYMGTEYTFTRKEALAAIWRYGTDENRRKVDGVKSILVYRKGTVMVGLESLTDREIKNALDAVTASIARSSPGRAKRKRGGAV